MNTDRDGPHEEIDELELSTCTVEASGEFGSATWVVPKKLYDILPRRHRDGLLKMTAERKIAPFFTGACERLLEQAGCSTDMSGLSTDWSFQTRDVNCVFGQVTWQIGSGVWEELPEDQRETLLEVADSVIHEYFHSDVLEPLMGYALNKLYG